MKRNLAFLIGIAGLMAVLGVMLMAPKVIWSVGTVSGTNITNADDAGTAGTADVAGDLVLTSTNAATVTAASTVGTTVSQGYDIADLAAPADQNAGIGADTDYAYSVKNLSNGTDTIKVTVLGTGATATGTAATSDWTISIYDDTGTIGVVDGTDAVQATGAGSTDVSFGFSVASNATLNFIVRLTAPGAGTAFNGDDYTVTTRAESNNGTPDTWDASDADISANPFGGGFTTRGDSFDDATTTTVQGPVMFASASVSAANELPGNALTYTIQYDNDGLASAAGVTIVNAVPTNTTYVQNSATGGNSPHTGATETPNINIGTLAVPNYQADGTAGTVVAVRWTFDIDVAVHDDSEGTDGTSGVDGDIPDVDAGQVQYQVTIN